MFSSEEIDKLKDGLLLGHVTKHAFELSDGEDQKSKMVIWNHPGNDYTGLMGRCRRIVDTTEKVSAVYLLFINKHNWMDRPTFWLGDFDTEAATVNSI